MKIRNTKYEIRNGEQGAAHLRPSIGSTSSRQASLGLRRGEGRKGLCGGNFGRSTGFTLVETLVAVAILMIAVAGPLVIASKGLTAALYARDQMIASFLAQESMEVVKNTRDNNLANGDLWLSGIAGDMTPCVRPPGNTTNACDASAVVTPIAACTIATNQCNLYFGGQGYQVGSSSGSPTLFSRYFYLTAIPGAVPAESTVTVVVKWNEGLIQNEMDLTSEITDAIR